jgi:hypothetical protein
MVEAVEVLDMLLRMLLMLVELELLYKEIMVVVPLLRHPTRIQVEEVVVLRWVLPQTDKEGQGQVRRLLVLHYFTLVEEVVVLQVALLILEQILYRLVEAVLVETEVIGRVLIFPLLLEQTDEVEEEEDEALYLLPQERQEVQVK